VPEVSAWFRMFRAGTLQPMPGVSDQRTSLCSLDHARRSGRGNACCGGVGVDRVIAVVGAGLTMCVAGMGVRFADAVPGGVACTEASRRRAGLRRRALQRRAPIPTRTRAVVVPAAGDGAPARASSRELPRARPPAARQRRGPPRTTRARGDCSWCRRRPLTSHEAGRVPDLWCMIESSGGHSAAYAWC
jgi:hypothetical protein